MGLSLNEAGTGSDFTPAPEGSHAAVCVGVVDLGTQPGSETYPKPKHKVHIIWALPAETYKIDDVEHAMTVGRPYTFSMARNAGLRKDLESWRGQKFTTDDLNGPDAFHLRKLIGKECNLSIIHNQSGDKTYANIASVQAMPKGMSAPEGPLPEVIFYEIDSHTNELFEQLPEWLREKVSQSPEYKEKVLGQSPDTTHLAGGGSDNGPPMPPAETYAADYSDPMPF